MQFANDGHICRAFTPQYAKAQLSPCAGWCLLRQQQVQQDSSNTHTQTDRHSYIQNAMFRTQTIRYGVLTQQTEIAM